MAQSKKPELVTLGNAQAEAPVGEPAPVPDSAPAEEPAPVGRVGKIRWLLRPLRWLGGLLGGGGKQDGKSWLQRWTGIFADVRSLATSLLTLALFGVVVYTVGSQIPRNAVVIDPIDMPKDLVASGYTPTVAANRLMDRMLEIRAEATTAKPGRELAPDWSQLDIEVPGTGMSVKTVLRLIRSVLGLSETRIGGEVVRDGEQLKLRLRLAGRGKLKELPVSDHETVDGLIEGAALELLKKVDPYILASYLNDRYTTARARGEDRGEDRAAALEAIDIALLNDDGKDDAWAYNLWGLILADEKSAEEAIEKYDLAASLDPDFALPINNRGVVRHDLLEDLNCAEIDYIKAIGINPSLASAYNNWGLVLMTREDWARAARESSSQCDSSATGATGYAGAIAKFEAAIERAPKQPRYVVNRGLALTRSGSPQDAIAAFKKALLINHRFAPAYVGWGQALLHEALHGEAIAAFEKALLADRHFAEAAQAYLGWGQALIEQQRYAEAEAKVREARRLMPDDQVAACGLVRALVGQAVEKGNQLKKPAGLRVSEKFKLDSDFRDLGRQALDLDREATCLEAKNALAFFNLGQAAQALGSNSLAVESYEAAVRNDTRTFGYLQETIDRLREVIGAAESKPGAEAAAP